MRLISQVRRVTLQCQLMSKDMRSATSSVRFRLLAKPLFGLKEKSAIINVEGRLFQDCLQKVKTPKKANFT